MANSEPTRKRKRKKGPENEELVPAVTKANQSEPVGQGRAKATSAKEVASAVEASEPPALFSKAAESALRREPEVGKASAACAASKVTSLVASTREVRTTSAGSSAAAPRLPATPLSNEARLSSASSAAPERACTFGAASTAACLRLSSDCQPSMNVSQVVYLNKDEVSFGRWPHSTVHLDSTRFPAMISRTHGFLRRHVSQNGKCEEWLLRDNRSTNGILLNGMAITDAVPLRCGDVITVGRKLVPPEFEFVFEASSSAAVDAD